MIRHGHPGWPTWQWPSPDAPKTALEPESVITKIAFLDLQDQAPGIERLRQWALRAAAPRLGAVAVDVGCGTGTVLAELSRLVGPAGASVGVEPDPVLRELALSRHAGVPLTILAGTADRLPVADDSVDVLYCERVLQHVPDVEAAVAEFARVLRPGGIAVVIDTDYHTLRFSPLDEADERLVARRIVPEIAPNPGIAAQLPRYLRQAGLTVDPEVGASALTFVGAQVLEWPGTLAVIRRAGSTGAITETDAERIVTAVTAAAREGSAFLSAGMFAFLARKCTDPGAPELTVASRHPGRGSTAPTPPPPTGDSP
ncbi:MAG: methyltransferase domain-containing protein [Dermatophilaceae bacterium]